MQRRIFLASAALGLPALAFNKPFRDGQKQPGKGFFVKSGESRFGESTKLGGINANDIKVSGKDSAGEFAVFEYTGREKGGPPLHLHPEQDEVFFITEGIYAFKVGDDNFKLVAGDTIFLPRNIPHTFAQLTDSGKMVFIFQPAGKMEDFFRAIGALKAQPDPATGAKIFAEHGMKVVGPPLVF
jgi:quercetin dioxygenase-like cupin family protein